MFPTLIKNIEKYKSIPFPSERQEILKVLTDYLQRNRQKNVSIQLNFICTHNSRRSHLAQVWAQTAAAYYNIKLVNCYSGGTEATAVFPVVIETLERQGMSIKKLSDSNNPVYALKYDSNAQPIIAFSKKYNDSFNPLNEFAAIMTCNQADQECPFVTGSNGRIPIPYDDPKLFDGSEMQKEKYLERSIQIASEMLFVFGALN